MRYLRDEWVETIFVFEHLNEGYKGHFSFGSFGMGVEEEGTGWRKNFSKRI